MQDHGPFLIASHPSIRIRTHLALPNIITPNFGWLGPLQSNPLHRSAFAVRPSPLWLNPACLAHQLELYSLSLTYSFHVLFPQSISREGEAPRQPSKCNCVTSSTWVRPPSEHREARERETRAFPRTEQGTPFPDPGNPQQPNLLVTTLLFNEPNQSLK